MRAYRRILHATDFSPAGRAAFDWAVALARENRAQLLLVHVMVPPTPFRKGRVPPRSYEDLESAARRFAKSSLQGALAKARKAGAKALAILTDGVPFEEIVRTAKRRRADLIAIGTHGRSGFSRFLLGSVAERVVQSAACPVLTVRGGRSARRTSPQLGRGRSAKPSVRKHARRGRG